MKRTFLIAIAIISMTLASYAGTATAPFNSCDSNTEAVEKGKPHTKQYLDFKKALDAYEKDVNAAKSCDDLDEAALTFVFTLIASIDEEYDEEMTDEESELLSKQAERIEDKVNKLQQKWGCETDDD